MKKHKKVALGSSILASLLAGLVLVGCNNGTGGGSTSNTPTDNGLNWNTVGESAFSANVVGAAKISMSGTTPYVAYASEVGQKFAGVVQTFNGTAWVNVGSNFGDNVAEVALTTSANGTPYVAYQDLDNNGHLTVKQFNGTSWVAVGDASTVDTPAGQASSINISLDNAGNPYVAYEWYPANSNNPWDMAGHPEVITYNSNSNSWSKVGNANIQDNAAAYVSMKISPDNVINLAYSNIGNYTGSLYLFNYNVNFPIGWQVVGFNINPSPYINLNVASQNAVMVIYADIVNGGGANEISFGNGLKRLANFANDNIGSTPSTVLSQNNVPYVAFLGTQNKGVLKSYSVESDSWSVVASSPSAIANPQLAVDSNNYIYVLYSEPQQQGKLTVAKYNALSN